MAYLTPDEEREERERQALDYPGSGAPGHMGNAPSYGGGSSGDWRPTPSGGPTPEEQAQPAGWDWYEDQIKKLEQQYGLDASNRASDVANLRGKNVGDVSPYLAALQAQYKGRAASNNFSSMPGATTTRPGVPASPWGATFSDPLTQQYEQLLQSQLGLYQQQMQQMKDAVARAEQRRAATESAGKNLEGYINERVTKLKGPAYTGAEQEVLRTGFLDPLERDREAARKRALQSISYRGFTPESGIAAELMSQVDRAFDEQRTRGQGAISTRQIEEQRSREQEAQQLLQYLTMLPDAMARGDLDFVNYTQGLVSHPGQQGLSIAQILADLPSDRLHDALATLGLGGNGSNTSAQLMALLQQSQQQRQLQQLQAGQAWSNIGASFLPR